MRAHPTDTCGKPPFRIFRLDAEELPDILYGVHHLPSTLVVTSPNVLWMCWSHPYPVHTCPRFDSFHFIIFRSRRDVLGCTSFPLGCSRSSCLGIRGVLDPFAHLARLCSETRVTPLFLSHPVHVASCFLFPSLSVNPPCSLRTLHFLHALHQMTDRMRKMSSPAAFSNAALSPMSFSCSSRSRLFPRTSD